MRFYFPRPALINVLFRNGLRFKYIKKLFLAILRNLFSVIEILLRRWIPKTLPAVRGNLSNMPAQLWWAKLIPKFITPLIVKYLTLGSKKVQSPVITLSQFIEEKKIDCIHLIKIDCEGEEINVLRGIKNKHWKLINSVIMEVNDISNNIEVAKEILSKNGFKNIKMEKEKGFEKTKLINICAKK